MYGDPRFATATTSSALVDAALTQSGGSLGGSSRLERGMAQLGGREGRGKNGPGRAFWGAPSCNHVAARRGTGATGKKSPPTVHRNADNNRPAGVAERLNG